VVNIPGRGYRFVAPVTIVEDPPPPSEPAVIPASDPRTAIMPDHVAQYRQGYLLTLVGPGGTRGSVSLALVPEMAGMQQDRILLVNLNSVEDH
jgi:hypothetical protein